MGADFENSDLAALAKVIARANAHNGRLYNLQLQETYERRMANHPNPLVRYGGKVFSQTDEVGITLEICRRLKLDTGTFLEFGVGDGTENNSLALLAAGWKGAWFGGQDLAFDPAASSRLAFTKDWITRANVLELAQTAIAGLGGDAVDLVSLDLDGNDLYLIEELLEGGVRPGVFIAEYNAKFMPPLRFAIAYDPSHQWASDDYFGASLASLDDVFSGHGYRLVCCNAATGGNAFFVRNEFSDRFADVPEDIRDIYVPPNYNTYNFFGHKVSVKTVLQCIA